MPAWAVLHHEVLVKKLSIVIWGRPKIIYPQMFACGFPAPVDCQDAS
jgi:hypothetical protein